MAKFWYVIHTYSGHENKVKNALERIVSQSEHKDKFGQILVATEEFAEMKNGKRVISQRRTFPSYVLIEMELTPETQHMVINVPGVTRFVGTAQGPSPLQPEDVDRVLGQMEESKGKPFPDMPFKVGDHVKVIDGPFSDFTGVVDEINPERGKLKVMVSIFGRATPVELDFLQVSGV